MNIQTMGAPGVGPAFSHETCVVYNRTGATVVLGDVLMLDLYNSETTHGSSLLQPNVDVGNAVSSARCHPWGNAITPSSATTPSGLGAVGSDPGFIFGVVSSLMTGGGADDTKVQITLRGVVEARLKQAPTIGTDLYPENGVRTLQNVQTAAGQRCIARPAIGDGTTAPYNAAGTFLVLFDGLSGSIGAATYAS